MAGWKVAGITEGRDTQGNPVTQLSRTKRYNTIRSFDGVTIGRERERERHQREKEGQTDRERTLSTHP